MAIELHPGVYVSFIAINLCLLFAYREIVRVPHQQEPIPWNSAHARADVFSDGKQFGFPSLGLSDGSQSQTVERTEPTRTQMSKVETTIESSRLAELPKQIQALKDNSLDVSPSTAGAALAAVSEKPTPKRVAQKKVRKSHNGLIPPPPPGVMVVPPPPDAPSLFAAGTAGKFGFLVPPPPPMVFDSIGGDSAFQTSYRKTTRQTSDGQFKNNERAKTVHRGSFKQVIVSR